jgi:hypothetical protein
MANQKGFKMNTLQSLKDQLSVKKDLLYKMKNDPMATDLSESIESDHDSMLWDEYAHVLDQFPFYVCGRGKSSFIDFIKQSDVSFYSQSLNDFADSYDVESLPEFQDLESEIEDLQSEIEDLF